MARALAVHRRVRANGVTFHVNRLRTGPPGDRPLVVCIHGFAVAGGAASSFLLGFNLARDADVVTYDLRGHGRTEVPPSGYSIVDHAQDLSALLDALDITEPVHLVGFSYGGAVATLAAMRHPERVASLSLLDGIVPVEGWEKAFYASIEHYEGVIALAKAQGMSMDAIIEACVRAVMEDQGVSHRRASSIGERIYRVFEQTTMKEDLRTEVAFAEAEFRHIRCPVLGVYGSQSDLYPLTDRLPALVPDATVYTLPGAGHMEVYFRVEELRAIVRNFLGLPGALPPPDRAWRNV
jgi:pimeloyl-ACP methyl ester carboxylesterase